MSHTAAFVTPGLQQLRQRGCRQVRMALQEPIEAPQIAHPNLVAVAERLHPRDVLPHCRAKNTAPIGQRPQPLQGAFVVVFQQSSNDRVQEPTVLCAQFHQRMGTSPSGYAPVKVAGDHAYSVHNTCQR